MSAKGPVAVCCQAVASRRAFSTAARRAASDKSRYILQKDDATFPKGFQAAVSTGNVGAFPMDADSLRPGLS